ncbi:MAG: AraC family transcriptional regulator [Verrucomicrobiota bacterium]
MKEIDEFSGLLEGPRARGAFALRGLLESPWSLRIEAEAPLTVIAMVEGSCHLKHDNGEEVTLGLGDVAVTRGPEHYTVSDFPDTEPTIFIMPGQDCRAPDGRSLHEEMKLGVRTWGNDAEASNLMLVGSYESMADVSERLRNALPPLLWVKSQDWNSPLIQMLSDEMKRDAPGQAAVLDRMLDMILIAIVRAWFEREETKEMPWYQAKGDPVVAETLKLIHKSPADPWTLSSLATKVGISRAALAKRFNEVVGAPPMAFLTQWRLALAADLLCEPGETVGTVADRVGYSSPYALSSAFKRVRGVSPQEHRESVLAAG